MLAALMLIAVISIIGATSLDIAGVDQRVAAFSRRHVAAVNAADAGAWHARYQLMHEVPADEGWDTGSGAEAFVTEADAETWYAGTDFPGNLGTYEVRAAYLRCAPPPAGYSTEAGSGWRSDYWEMTSRGRFVDAGSGEQTSPVESTVLMTVRKVMRGPCKVR
jgi:hypothetical protein